MKSHSSRNNNIIWTGLNYFLKIIIYFYVFLWILFY